MVHIESISPNELLNVVKNKNDRKICISMEEVSLALSSAKPGKACGPDTIIMWKSCK